MKELNINGVVYAKYEIDKQILFLKVIAPFPNYQHDSVGFLEELYSHFIALLERETFKGIAYLNV